MKVRTHCRAWSIAGRRMEIRARISLDADTLQYDEAGLLEDGRAAFRVPEGYRYEFRRR